jgi:hypothetical protein
MATIGPHTARDIEVAPQLAELDLRDVPDGPGAAAMVAAGVGIFVLGFLTTVNEMSEGMHTFLAAFDFGQGVGPLAGKTTLAVVAWLIAWGILGSMWRRKDVDLRRMFGVGLAFGVAGAVLTFPPVFTLFA